jgi:hypothetical protein
MVAELTTCCVPEDPASHVSMGGYIMSRAVFYE